MSEAASGKKRPAAPEKNDTKDLFDVEVADDVHKKLEDISRDVLRADIANGAHFLIFCGYPYILLTPQPLSQRDFGVLSLFFFSFPGAKKTSRRIERAALKRLAPVYQKRRELVKKIPKFWPVTLMNSSIFAQHCQHADDQKALIALEDLWVERDPVEDRTFTLEFVSLLALTVISLEYKC